MVPFEFDAPTYIAPLKALNIQVKDVESEAEVSIEMDNTPAKLDYHRIATGFRQLVFLKISKQ